MTRTPLSHTHSDPYPFTVRRWPCDSHPVRRNGWDVDVEGYRPAIHSVMRRALNADFSPLARPDHVPCIHSEDAQSNHDGCEAGEPTERIPSWDDND